MISPEKLRRFPFFGLLDDAQYKAIAMISEEVSFEKNAIVLETGQPADALYLLLKGDASLHYVVTSENDPYYKQEYHISDINPGEIVGISAMVDPYIYSSRVRAHSVCHLIKINAVTLRALCAVDCKLSNAIMTAVAAAAMERLEHTRVQLVAAQPKK